MRLAFYAAFLVACTAWDLYATSLVTPDLKHELNPLIRCFGGSWGTLLTEQTVMTAVTLWLVRHSLTVNTPLHPAQPGLSIGEFVIGLFFKNPKSWGQVLFRVPDRRGATMYVIGSIAFFAAPLAHLQAGMSNWLVIHSESYERWFDHNLPWTWLGLAIGIVPISIGMFLLRDYVAYRQAQSLHV